jgi:hypothetical protein
MEEFSFHTEVEEGELRGYIVLGGGVLTPYLLSKHEARSLLKQLASQGSVSFENAARIRDQILGSHLPDAVAFLGEEHQGELEEDHEPLELPAPQTFLLLDIIFGWDDQDLN